MRDSASLALLSRRARSTTAGGSTAKKRGAMPGRIIFQILNRSRPRQSPANLALLSLRQISLFDQPSKILKAGETFYEPGGCLHRVSRNPGKVKMRMLAWVLHPRDAKDLVIPVKQ